MTEGAVPGGRAFVTRWPPGSVVLARPAGRAEPAEYDLRLIHPNPGQIGLEAGLLAPQAGTSTTIPHARQMGW